MARHFQCLQAIENAATNGVTLLLGRADQMAERHVIRVFLNGE
jgi:hypothetical protein